MMPHTYKKTRRELLRIVKKPAPPDPQPALRRGGTPGSAVQYMCLLHNYRRWYRLMHPRFSTIFLPLHRATVSFGQYAQNKAVTFRSGGCWPGRVFGIGYWGEQCCSRGGMGASS